MRRKTSDWRLTTIAALLCCCSLSSAFSDEIDLRLYRFIDEDGIKVIAHTLPPEYAQKGYEILSPSGQVIEVINPAPTKGEIAQENAEQGLREKYAVLKRRYSSSDEIERAKIRRLENINTNISILRGNIGSINIKIENFMGKATDMERSGRDVSRRLLQRLADAVAELTVAENALTLRLDEHKSVSDRFDRDLAIFQEGSKLADVDNQFN